MISGMQLALRAAAAIAGAFAVGMLLTSHMLGLIPLLPTLYVIPLTIKQIRFERGLRRELRSWLHG